MPSLKCNIFIILTITAVLVIAQDQPRKREVDDDPLKLQLADSLIEKDRMTRQSKPTRSTTPKPLGFFGTIGTIGRLIYEQYNDTKSGFSQVSEILNSQFSDSQPSTRAPPKSDENDGNSTTTEAPQRLSRAEFLEILRRNLIGLRRLYNLEMREALADSKRNMNYYRSEFNREIYKQLQDH